MSTDKRKNIIDKYNHLFDTRFAGCDNFNSFLQIGDGWLDIVEAMLHTIDQKQKWVAKNGRFPDGIMNINISCIKEKFAYLTVYYNTEKSHNASWVDGVIAMATTLAMNTCECCSTIDKEILGRTSGWMTIICKPCYDKKESDWKDRNKWKLTVETI